MPKDPPAPSVDKFGSGPRWKKRQLYRLNVFFDPTTMHTFDFLDIPISAQLQQRIPPIISPYSATLLLTLEMERISADIAKVDIIAIAQKTYDAADLTMTWVYSRY